MRQMIGRFTLSALFIVGILIVSSSDQALARCCDLTPPGPGGGCNNANADACTNQGGIFDPTGECVGNGQDALCVPAGTPTPTITNTPGGTPIATATPTNTFAPGTPTPAPGELDCDDDMDNDLDGLTDCEDPDCAGFPGCSPGAPVMSPVLLMLLAGSLAMFAVFRLSRSTRSDR